MEDEIKKIVRRLDSLQKTQDLMYQDRNILEDILARLGAVETALHLNREHQTEVQKDAKADMLDVKHAVEDKVEEIKTIVADETVTLVEQKDKSMFSKLLKRGEK